MKQNQSDPKWDRINEQNILQLKEDARKWDKTEWRAVLQQAPIDGLFYALMKQIMKALDTIQKYEAVKTDIDRIYANDMNEW